MGIAIIYIVVALAQHNATRFHSKSQKPFKPSFITIHVVKTEITVMGARVTPCVQKNTIFEHRGKCYLSIHEECCIVGCQAPNQIYNLIIQKGHSNFDKSSLRLSTKNRL
jgi:hypothetical protein